MEANSLSVDHRLNLNSKKKTNMHFVYTHICPRTHRRPYVDFEQRRKGPKSVFTQMCNVWF